VRVAFRVDLTLPLPASISDDRSSRTDETIPTPVSVRVTLDAGSPRVGFGITVDNAARDHRLRVLFPLGAASIAGVRAETAFAVVERPARRPRPADVRVEVPVVYGPTSGFTEAGDDAAGAIVFGDGLVEYEPYTDGPPALALTLLRCVGFLSRDDLAMRPSGHAGPGRATPGAQCPGRHEFRLAFEPRRQRPRPSALFAQAASFVAPPLVASGAAAGDGLPAIGTFVGVESAGGAVVLSACKYADDRDTLVCRLFNPDDEPAALRLTTASRLATATALDLHERPLHDLTVQDGGLQTTVGPHQITTFELRRRTSGDST
jgi:mannosylglycerate hydrolase